MFGERAAAADSALVLDEDSVRLIAGMCQRLDGMALPIELVAVRAATHGIAATARQLGERFSLGWSGRRTARPRQQTLQATLDWSYDLLSDVERLVFERLAIFVGPFSIDAALDIASDEARALVDAAITRCTAIGEHFATPELLRIKAEIVHRLDGDCAAGEALLHDSIALARAQGARAWERKASDDIAALVASG